MASSKRPISKGPSSKGPSSKGKAQVRKKPPAKATAKAPAKAVAKPAAKPAAPAAKTQSKRVTPKASTRYTPPVPRSQKVSPMWVPIVMFTCLLGGMLMIILNYVGVLPGGTSNGYLLGGLGLITAGFLTATRYH